MLELNSYSKLPLELSSRILEESLEAPKGKFLAILFSVCQQWKYDCNNLSIKLLNKCLNVNEIFSNDKIKKIFDFLEVQAIKPNSSAIDSVFNREIAVKWLNLRYLNFSRYQSIKGVPSGVPDYVLNQRPKVTSNILLQLTQLHNLDLSQCSEITDEELKSLVPLTQLYSLALSSCVKITNKGVKILTQLMQLSSLNLSECIEITDKGLKILTQLTQLSSLNLSCCSKITDEGLKSLVPLTQLSSLNLSCCSKITDEGLKSLVPLTQLSSLNLSCCSSCCSKITDDGLKSLEQLTQLSSLDLTWCLKITDEGLKSLTQLTELTQLHKLLKGYTR